MKHNFKIINPNDEKEYWVSRSVAAMSAIFAYDSNDYLCVLVNKRGNALPNYKGCWNMPGGFIEYDETIQMGVSREVKEETGLEIEPSNFNFIGVHSDPASSDAQNITFRFWVHLPKPVEYYKPMLTARHADNGEVTQIEFMRVCNIAQYKNANDFAFNHFALIHYIVETFYFNWNGWYKRIMCKLFNKYFMKFV